MPTIGSLLVEIRANSVQFQAEMEKTRKGLKNTGDAFNLTQQRAERFVQEGLNRVADFSNQLGNVLGDLANKSKGVAAGLGLVGRAFAAAFAFQAGHQIGAAIRDIVTLGDTFESYQRKQQLATEGNWEFIRALRAARTEVAQSAAALAQSRAGETESRLSLIGGQAADVGGAQARLEATQASIRASSQQIAEALENTFEQALKKARAERDELVALETGLFTQLKDIFRVGLGLAGADDTASDRLLALAQEHQRVVDKIEADRDRRRRQADDERVQRQREALAKYDADLDASARKEIARVAAVRAAVRDALEATMQARRAAGLAALGAVGAGLEAAEASARSRFDPGAQADAIRRQQANQAAILGATAQAQLAQVEAERRKTLDEITRSVEERAKTEQEAAQLRTQTEETASAKVLEIRTRENESILRLGTSTFDRLNALREQEISRVLAQQEAIRNAITARQQAESSARASGLDAAGRSGEAAAESARARLAEIQSGFARETVALREQLRKRQIDEQSFARISVENERRASAQRLQVRQQEQAAIRQLISSAAGVEGGLGIKDGLFKGLESIRKLGQDTNTAVQAFAALQRAGVPLDDIFGSLSAHGEAIRKRFNDLMESFKGNPLLQRALLNQFGDLQTGDLRDRIRDAVSGASKSSLGKDDLRKAIGLVKDDFKDLQDTVNSFSTDSATTAIGTITTAVGTLATGFMASIPASDAARVAIDSVASSYWNLANAINAANQEQAAIVQSRPALPNTGAQEVSGEAE